MFERYSEQARTTVVSAKREACRLGYSEMNPDHILLALLDDSTMLRRVMAADSIEEMRRFASPRLSILKTRERMSSVLISRRIPPEPRGWN